MRPLLPKPWLWLWPPAAAPFAFNDAAAAAASRACRWEGAPVDEPVVESRFERLPAWLWVARLS